MTTAARPATLDRRALLRGGLALAAGTVTGAWPAWLGAEGFAAQPAAAPAKDVLAERRAAMAGAPIQALPLTDTLTMLSGPGGNIVVLNGKDGKVVVDTFVQGAWAKLKASLDALGPAPIKAAIDTHWHFDHADNNAPFRAAGAAVIAHENTAKRMSQRHDLTSLGLVFPASPPDALPTQTFKATHTIDANGDQIALAYVPPAHTDTDISIRFAKGNVLHLGDLFFNGMYPFIDVSTGGNIAGMIAAADASLALVDARTKIVPGHGPLADRAALVGYRDMMVTVRDRVAKLKAAGRTADETLAAKPTADLDDVWAKGFLTPDMFVSIVYGTI
jgi:glyoxylase-like metal-dependent hydrolase (beta-lactamase superfamily II)